ncbi:hypothetical protein [Streptomyces fractus]|uniref:hypothetical protein n=1 Tax=Streptomyces fractus TaxID=641806 RepID=UPI003CF67AA0
MVGARRRGGERGRQIRPDADLDWARTVYYALIHEAAIQSPETDAAVDALATRVVDTLLHGVGTPASG